MTEYCNCLNLVMNDLTTNNCLAIKHYCSCQSRGCITECRSTNEHYCVCNYCSECYLSGACLANYHS